jgi:hypothetical protein
MPGRTILTLTFAGTLALAALKLQSAQPSAQSGQQPAAPARPPATAAATSTAGGPAPAGSVPAPPVPAAFAPGFDDLMTMLVQPRHIKLYYAGTQRNWELAAAESRDLRGALKRIVSVLPTYQGNDVDAAIVSIIAPRIDQVDAAIAAADPSRFAAAYAELTTACTACHTYLEHPFIVIKVPSDPTAGQTYSDQDFGAAP